MSWEDCGFRPGKIHGPATCPRHCGDCDGKHHFYAGFSDEEVMDSAEPIFQCKHCDAWAEMVDDDGSVDGCSDEGEASDLQLLEAARRSHPEWSHEQCWKWIQDERIREVKRAERIRANDALQPQLFSLLCVSVSLWSILSSPSAQARPIIGLSTDAPGIVHRGDVFTATVYLVNGVGPPAANLIGVDWSLPYPAVFHVLSRTLEDSPFTDPLALDPTPGGVDLGGTVPDVTIPAPIGCWTLAALRIQVDANAPFGPYTLTTLSPDGAGAVTADFTDHPFTLHTTWPIEIADSQILKSQMSNSEIQTPEPASALLLALIFLIIEFGLGSRRKF